MLTIHISYNIENHNVKENYTF